MTVQFRNKIAMTYLTVSCEKLFSAVLWIKIKCRRFS